jgi:hypothetical protein
VCVEPAKPASHKARGARERYFRLAGAFALNVQVEGTAVIDCPTTRLVRANELLDGDARPRA